MPGLAVEAVETVVEKGFLSWAYRRFKDMPAELRIGGIIVGLMWVASKVTGGHIKVDASMLGKMKDLLDKGDFGSLIGTLTRGIEVHPHGRGHADEAAIGRAALAAQRRLEGEGKAAKAGELRLFLKKLDPKTNLALRVVLGHYPTAEERAGFLHRLALLEKSEDENENPMLDFLQGCNIYIPPEDRLPAILEAQTQRVVEPYTSGQHSQQVTAEIEQLKRKRNERKNRLNAARARQGRR